MPLTGLPPECRQDHPDGLYRKFVIQFELDQDTGNYSLYCPEWRCELACGKHPGHTAYGLIMEIVGHNTEEMREQVNVKGC